MDQNLVLSYIIHAYQIYIMLRKYLFFGFTFPFLIACNKDEKLNTVVIDYYPLGVGNYWIYQNYLIDTSGLVNELSFMDSVTVVGDTSLSGNIYKHVKSYEITDGVVKRSSSTFLRDSLDYIVDQDGQIILSSSDNSYTLYQFAPLSPSGDAFVEITYRMKLDEETVSVPAGEFEAISLQGSLRYNGNAPGSEYPRHFGTYYAEGVGKVFERYFYANQADTQERRLLRYQLID